VDTVGIRELKNQLSRHLKRVQAGERLIVTEHGKPIARLEPVEQTSAPEWMWQMVREGRAHWNGGKPRGARVPIHAPNARLAEAVLEDREDRV
jgi:prevent-host-death family protein